MKKSQRIVTVATLVCIVSLPSFASSTSGILLADRAGSGVTMADGATAGVTMADSANSGILLADRSNSGILLADRQANNNPFGRVSIFDQLYGMMDIFWGPIF